MSKRTNDMRKRRRQLADVRSAALNMPGPAGDARRSVATADAQIAAINADEGVRQADAAEHRVQVLAAASTLITAATDPDTDGLTAMVYSLEARNALERLMTDPDCHVWLAVGAMHRAAESLWQDTDPQRPGQRKKKNTRNRPKNKRQAPAKRFHELSDSLRSPSYGTVIRRGA
jgi:hypothetical protein